MTDHTHCSKETLKNIRVVENQALLLHFLLKQLLEQNLGLPFKILITLNGK